MRRRGNRNLDRNNGSSLRKMASMNSPSSLTTLVNPWFANFTHREASGYIFRLSNGYNCELKGWTQSRDYVTRLTSLGWRLRLSSFPESASGQRRSAERGRHCLSSGLRLGARSALGLLARSQAKIKQPGQELSTRGKSISTRRSSAAQTGSW